MKTPKTIMLIECSTCKGTYYGGNNKLVLNPGTENELPDEVAVTVRKIAACTSCKEREDRTFGGKRKRFER